MWLLIPVISDPKSSAREVDNAFVGTIVFISIAVINSWFLIAGISNVTKFMKHTSRDGVIIVASTGTRRTSNLPILTTSPV